MYSKSVTGLQAKKKKKKSTHLKTDSFISNKNIRIFFLKEEI